jgi:hypothetical protein
MIRVRFQDGVHHFDVDENLDDNRFRLVSCNVVVPKKVSCHPDLDSVRRGRMEARDGEGKGRAISLVEQKLRITLAVMTVHVNGKRLLVEIHVDPDARDGLIYAGAVHLRDCARRIAAHPEMFDGNETFYLAIGYGRRNNRLRQAILSLGMVKIDPGMGQRVRFQDLYECRPSQRVEVARSRSKARA